MAFDWKADGAPNLTAREFHQHCKHLVHLSGKELGEPHWLQKDMQSELQAFEEAEQNSSQAAPSQNH